MTSTQRGSEDWHESVDARAGGRKIRAKNQSEEGCAKSVVMDMVTSKTKMRADATVDMRGCAVALKMMLCAQCRCVQMQRWICEETQYGTEDVGHAVSVQYGRGDVKLGNEAMGHRGCEAGEDMYCSTGDAKQSNDAMWHRSVKQHRCRVAQEMSRQRYNL